MGLFSGIKNTHHQALATTYVQSLLKHQVKTGSLTQDPKKLGERLVNYQWEMLPEVFNGERNPRPLKVTVAVSALASGLQLLEKDDPDQLGITIALGLLLQDIALGKQGSSFNVVDLDFIAGCTKIFKERVGEMNEELYIDGTYITEELQALILPNV
jgi:hypothetical protein